MIGFEKRANFIVDAARRAKTPLMVAGGLGVAGYGASKVVQKSEDPEQAQLRKMRKMNALPYQGNQQ